MNTKLANVAEFHEIYNQPVREFPNFNIPQKEYELRIDLMYEECMELLQASQDKNIIEVADALCDMLYVVYGTILFHGLYLYWNDIYKAMKVTVLMDETNRQVFSRYLNIYKHAVTSSPQGKNGVIIYALVGMRYRIHTLVENHLNKNVFELLFNEVHSSNMSKLDEDSKPIIREDGKVLKGKNYFKPALGKILIDSGLL